VRAGIAAVRTLLHGAPAPKQRRIQATKFDAAYLNLDGNITPSRIAQSLARQKRGSLCFYGPPGTGKTAFAEVLALALDRELITAQASDLISPYVGETEQNLARLFRNFDLGHTVLLLDEVDSFLSDRQQARHSWERTQVNELLQQMEQFPGIFIAATNMMNGLDSAAMRRFDFKLHFRPLRPDQRIGLFAREVFGTATASVPPELVQYLGSLNGLTPGDFATVCRQRLLLDEQLTPKQFAQRLGAECDVKNKTDDVAALDQWMKNELLNNNGNVSKLLRFRN
jgi:SpoVK/Ycf46/Vps4 family AAA+-type ATPase